MKLNPKKILAQVKAEGFEKVWLRSAGLLPGEGQELSLGGRGRYHPVPELIQRMRQIFLNLGFDEVVTPIIVDEEEVYKQYGPEAPIILDRCYYLSTLPRPDIGLNVEKCQKIENLGVQLDQRKKGRLQKLLRDYKRGKIDADDLVERLSESLETSDDIATRIVREVFPEFTALKPTPSTMTLRSHLTSAWFHTLEVLQYRVPHPIKLFSVGLRFRREQSLDATHLRSHYGASCVALSDEVTVKDGKRVTEAVLKALGFREVRFVQKKVSSKYYAPKTEYEGFVKLPGTDKWIEVVDFGLYSPIALAHYDLSYSVLNVGLGVERIGMLLYDELDIRRLVYPQFYAEWTLSDEELARMVRISLEPETEMGRKIRDAIIEKAMAEAERPSPCEFVAFEGDVLTKRVRVSVYERDEGKKLLGPAALNIIYTYKGNVLGIPKRGMDEVEDVKGAREKGVPTEITYLGAIAALAAAKIEEEVVKSKPREVNVRVRLAELPSDVNIKIDEVAKRYIESNRKKIMIRGPTFIGIKAQFIG